VVRPDRSLLVDDEAGILEMMALVLADTGFTVQMAGSVAEARALVETGWVPDVAVVDLLMQPEDGSQLAAWLRETHPAVRIVVYSAWPETEALKILRGEMHADAFVPKPGGMSELIAAICGER
jgi:DNA-binding response OmpR family regulator